MDKELEEELRKIGKQGGIMEVIVDYNMAVVHQMEKEMEVKRVLEEQGMSFESDYEETQEDVEAYIEYLKNEYSEQDYDEEAEVADFRASLEER